jgi:hypothetical protein
MQCAPGDHDGVIAGDDALFFVAQDVVEADGAERHKGTGRIPRCAYE